MDRIRTNYSLSGFNSILTFVTAVLDPGWVGGGGGTPYNGLYGEAPPERGTFIRLQV